MPQVGYYLNDDIVQRIKKIAMEEGVYPANIVQAALIEYLEKHEQQTEDPLSDTSTDE